MAHRKMGFFFSNLKPLERKFAVYWLVTGNGSDFLKIWHCHPMRG